MSDTCQCGRAVVGAFLCPQCVQTAEYALAHIYTYWRDLPNVRAGMTRYGDPGGHRTVGREQPLPFDGRWADPAGRGSDVEWATRNTLTTWARILLDTWPPTGRLHCAVRSCVRCADVRRREHPRSDDPADLCAYLLGMLSLVAAAAPWADQLLDELVDTEGRLRSLVDRPADRWYAGGCTCGRELWAVSGNPWIQCRDCGETWDVAICRERLRTEAEDRLATVESIARVAITLGDVRTTQDRVAGRVRQWARRGSITAHGQRVVDGVPRPLYRIGDVLDRLADDAASRTAG